MAKKKVTEQPVVEVQKYKGSQLLALEKYNNRVGRIVLNPDKFYSFEEADNLVDVFLGKRG